MRISVVVITKNQRSFLEQSLPRIVSQEKLTHQPEIIVVDSGSTDGTRTFAPGQGARLVCLEPSEFGYARANNAGAAAATSDIVVRLSGDAVPADGEWLHRLTEPFRDEQVACTWGSQTLPTNGNYSVWERFVHSALHSAKSDAPVRVTGRARTVLGCNMAIRRTLWQQHSYDERLPQAEDYAWAQHWLQDREYAGVFVPSAAVLHGHSEPLLRGIGQSLVQSVLQGLILSGFWGQQTPASVAVLRR